MAVDFVKYDPHTRELFATEICNARKMGSSTGASSSRLDLACSSNEVQENTTIQSLNILVWILARLSCIAAEGLTETIVKSPCVIRLSAREHSLPLLLSS